MDSLAGLFRLADGVLRGDRIRARVEGAPGLSASAIFALLIVGFGMFYGGVMGTYGGLAGDRPWQLVYSAVKVPFLIMTTFALSMPSFYVINTLLGLRNDFPRVIRALMTTQAGLTVILTSLSPLTAFWYVSGSDYQPAILFNGAMFAVASFGAQWMLRREYEPLIRRDPKHRWMLRAWIFIYVFVGVQMAWVLRPFVGDPRAPVQFFREDSWSNAYEVVLQMIWQVLMGRGR
jgi:hypothetical protein